MLLPSYVNNFSQEKVLRMTVWTDRNNEYYPNLFFFWFICMFNNSISEIRVIIWNLNCSRNLFYMFFFLIYLIGNNSSLLFPLKLPYKRLWWVWSRQWEVYQTPNVSFCTFRFRFCSFINVYICIILWKKMYVCLLNLNNLNLTLFTHQHLWIY